MKNLPFSKTPPKVTEEYIQNQILEILRGKFDLKKGLLDRIAAIPLRFRLQYVKALFCPGKKAVAIKMKCYECVGFESLSDRIGNCNIRTCPLWLHRPCQKKSTIESNDEEE